LPTKFQINFNAKYLLTISSIVGGYLVLVILDDLSTYQHHTFCIFKLVTHIPCPGCGMGRATLELFKGNIISSLNYNILSIPFNLTIIISLLWLIIDLIKKKETFFKYINHEIKMPYKLLVLGLIIIDWNINIFRHI
jgi:hypothetical protein